MYKRFRITSAQDEIICELVKEGHYKNGSEFVREAITEKITKILEIKKANENE